MISEAATEDWDGAMLGTAPATRDVADPTERGDADPRPRIVIIGAGFGGLTAAKAWRGLTRTSRLSISIITICFSHCSIRWRRRRLSPANIAAPIRGILRDQANATVLLGEGHRRRPRQRVGS